MLKSSGVRCPCAERFGKMLDGLFGAVEFVAALEFTVFEGHVGAPESMLAEC